MGTKVEFIGTIVRTEPGGFGIVHFDKPVGPGANTFGIVSRSAGTSSRVFSDLKTGVRVTGTADADERQLAIVTDVAVKTSR